MTIQQMFDQLLEVAKAAGWRLGAGFGGSFEDEAYETLFRDLQGRHDHCLLCGAMFRLVKASDEPVVGGVPRAWEIWETTCGLRRIVIRGAGREESSRSGYCEKEVTT